MPRIKREEFLFGNTTEFADLVASGKKITRIKNNYYAARHAIELLPVLQDLLNNPRMIVFETKKFKVSVNTLRSLISNAWAFLLEQGPTAPEFADIKDNIPWEDLKILRNKCRIHMTPEALVIAFKYNDAHKELYGESVDWNGKLRQWLSEESQEPLELQRLSLTPQEIDIIKHILDGFGGLVYEISPTELKVRRMA